MEPLIMRREWAMPAADTFDIPVIGAFVRKYLNQSKISVDPFARNKRWATYTNDLNPETQADSHVEAKDFLDSLVDKGVKSDLVIFDPPYSIAQCSMVYQNVGLPVTQRDVQIWGRWTEHKAAIANLLTPDGYVLTFGWNSQGMGLKHGFILEELLLVCHGSAHNDTICIAERRAQDRFTF
jgi:hypothetical protein